MPMDQALRAVPGLRVLDPSPQIWWEAQGSLGDFLQHWTPQGQLGRMGEALVELQGTQRLFGPLVDTAERMRRELAEQHGWASHGGLSLSATAAQIAAHAEHSLELVADGAEATFLAPQPLRRLPDLAPAPPGALPPPGPALLRRPPARAPARAGGTHDHPKAAPDLRAQVRGEDRPGCPCSRSAPGHARHGWRLQPPRLPEEVALAARCLDWLWSDPRHPRRLVLRWWDVDGEPHTWRAPPEDLRPRPWPWPGVSSRPSWRAPPGASSCGRWNCAWPGAWAVSGASSRIRSTRAWTPRPTLARLRRRFRTRSCCRGGWDRS